MLATKIDNVSGMIEIDVLIPDSPWTTCMSNGSRKLAAVPTNNIVAMHATVARSPAPLRTSSENSTGSLASMRLRVHRRKACTKTTPRIRISRTGDRPAMENGALVDAWSRPHEFRKLKPTLNKMMPVDDNAAPVQPMLDANEPAMRRDTTCAKGMPEARKPIAWAFCLP